MFIDKEEIRIQVANPLDKAIKAFATEAIKKEYKREDIEKMITAVREEMYNAIYGEETE